MIAEKHEQLTNIYFAALNQLTWGVIIIDTSGLLLFINRFAQTFLHLEDADVTGSNFLETSLPIIFNKQLIRQTIDQHQIFDNEEGLFSYAGKNFYVNYSVSSLFNPVNQSHAALVSFEDATLNRQLAESIYSDDRIRFLGKLSLHLAHEIRSPITAIKAFIQLLPQQYANPEYQAELLRHVPAEVDRLDNLITQLLEYARPQAVEKKWCNLYIMVYSVIDLLKYNQQYSKVNLIVNIYPNMYLWVDEQQFKQVLLNLITNAADAVNNSGNILITARQRDDLNVLTIQDTGCGISPSNLDHLFTPFFTTKSEGTGLGLFIVRQLLRANGGGIHITSEVGKGTSVEISFPNHQEGLEKC